MELRARHARWLAGPDPSDGGAWLNWVLRLRADDGAGAAAAVGTLQATVQPLGADRTQVAEVAWVVGTPWQRRGYATEATQALIAWLASGGATVEAHIAAGHDPSERVAARAGLVLTAETVDGERVWRAAGDRWLTPSSAGSGTNGRRGHRTAERGARGERERRTQPAR